MIKINRDVKAGTYTLSEIFDGLRQSKIIKQIFTTRKELDEVFSRIDVIVEEKDHYMYVKNEDGSIVVGLEHLQKSNSRVLYLDIVHELVHVRQQKAGLDLYDKSYSYVDRPTEIEAYKIAVSEAKRLGMSDKEILDYLQVEWITQEEHKRLATHVGVNS